MAFDLYFAGGSTQADIVNLMTTLSCNRLFSQYNDRNVISRLGLEDYPGKILLDSGAYSAFTRGVALDIDDYINYINTNDSWITLCACVDVLPGSDGVVVTPNECRRAAEMSWKNYLYMRERVSNPDKLVPTYHQGEPIEFLDNMLKWEDENGNHIPYIALGAIANLVNNNARRQFLSLCYTHIFQHNPTVKVHAFGMTDLELLEQFPVTSADSTTWLRAGAMGELTTKFGRLIISDKRDNYNGVTLDAVKEFVSSYGFDFDKLREDPIQRQLFNITYLYTWAKNYECKYKPAVKKRTLF